MVVPDYFANFWEQCRSLRSSPTNRRFFKVSATQGSLLILELKSIRRKEMVAIRKILIIRAANQAMAFSIPTLAAVLSFVTYGATRETLDPVCESTTACQLT